MTNKKLKVGNVPNLRFPGFEGEWESKKLSEIAEIGRGKSKHRPRDAEFLFGGKYPFVQTGDIRKADLFLTQFTQTYSEAGLMQSKLWNENTLCITIAANIAETAILKIKACFPDSIIGLIPKKNETTVLFVKHLFDKFKIEIQRLSQGVAQDNLNQEKLSKIEFSFPKLVEQDKVTSFLSSIDERIATQNKIIEELKLLKNTLSKKIFSGQLKFKDERGNDFPERKIKKLGDVFYSEKGKGISKNKIDANGKYGCVLYGELYTRYNEVIFDIVSKTNEEDGLKSQVGDLLIPSSTTTTGIDLANVTAINKENVLLGGDITVLRTKEKINNIFYAYYLSNHKKEEIASYAQGSTIVHLYYSHIKEMLIDIPSLQEQTRIALFLTSIDTKIDVEYQLLQELKEQKKYFLANLLI